MASAKCQINDLGSDCLAIQRKENNQGSLNHPLPPPYDQLPGEERDICWKHDRTVKIPGNQLHNLWSISHDSICSARLWNLQFFIMRENKNPLLLPPRKSWAALARPPSFLSCCVWAGIFATSIFHLRLEAPFVIRLTQGWISFLHLLMESLA